MTPPREVLDLVERFRNNRQAYQHSLYNETQLRREFLDPLFKALGWDIANEQGRSQLYQDVIHEDRVRMGGTLKAPDYALESADNERFFVEAKKPSLDLAQPKQAKRGPAR
jgi:predicted type IV restriction endonuclease